MHKNDTNRKRLTLRIDSRINDEIETKAKELGINKNSFISMVLHKEVKRKGGA
ncbi:hypothetical protein QGM71_01075 [Virgibacillus sp. C22-A2]|uniref:Toxin-antitoxin system HicB family antitoxin n=1 Tax=Virgibacillus tibetensis TaxID=3042313 RepID=A0ABU6KA13_9BACI|nr:hypothetical protein [Virgibacillus sp. C22-A2]